MVSKRILPTHTPFENIVSVSSADVVPQVLTYLILPKSLFHAGLIDISNQNEQLETVRINPSAMLEIRENPASFLRGYEGNYRYASDLSALEYGYGGDLGYYVIEAGFCFKKLKMLTVLYSLGVCGLMESFLYNLKMLYKVKKVHLINGLLQFMAVCSMIQVSILRGLLSYGLFKGDALIPIRGKTATLKGNPLSLFNEWSKNYHRI